MAVVGGLQDNGGSLLLPEDRKGTGKMGSPFGGDGGEVIVDPDNGCDILTEYVNLDLWITTTCGRSDGTTHAIKDVAPADPFPRFIAPFRADLLDKNHWVAGGQIVWTFGSGFALQNGSDWTPAFNQGSGPSTTTLSSVNDVVYAPWCGPCNNDVAIDPSDTTGKTVYVALNGFSRRWTEGPGVGGASLEIDRRRRDVVAARGHLPYTTVTDVHLGPDGKLYAATHGRGIWSAPKP